MCLCRLWVFSSQQGHDFSIPENDETPISTISGVSLSIHWVLQFLKENVCPVAAAGGVVNRDCGTRGGPCLTNDNPKIMINRTAEKEEKQFNKANPFFTHSLSRSPSFSSV